MENKHSITAFIVPAVALALASTISASQRGVPQERTWGLQNADGERLLRPASPKRERKNRVKTVPGEGWFTYLRFYSPAEAFFSQTSKPDVQDITEPRTLLNAPMATDAERDDHAGHSLARKG